MKILRKKLFFDYKGYAEKYGNKATQEMREARNRVAQEVNSYRSINTGTAKVAKESMKMLNPKSPTDIAAYKAAEDILKSTKDQSIERSALKHGKRKLKMLEDTHQENKLRVEESIKHHEEIANNLRRKKQRGEKLQGVVGWVKKNPGKSAAIGLSSAAIIGGAAYGVKKAIDKKNKKSSEKKD